VEEAAILAGISKVRSVPNSHEKRTPENSAQGLKMTIREIDGIPVCVGGERIARYRRGKKPKAPMAELGIERLKPQQRLALKNKFELGMSNRQAAVQAGYAETSASSILPRLLQRKPIQDALKDKGITDLKIAQVIAEGLEAMHPLRPRQPDHHARVKFVSEANKVLDNYPAKKIEVEDKSIVLHLTKDDYVALRKFDDLRRRTE
jgi:hypothetical protein